MLILLEVLAAAFLSFLATWFFLKKQINAQIDLSITAYDRGRHDEASRRTHEHDLLKEEINSLKEIEEQRFQRDEASQLIDYFSNFELSHEHFEEFPTSSYLKLLATLKEGDLKLITDRYEAYKGVIKAGIHMLDKDCFDSDVKNWHKALSEGMTWQFAVQREARGMLMTLLTLQRSS